MARSGMPWRKDAHAGAEHCVETEAESTSHITQRNSSESILTVWTGRPASTRALVTAISIDSSAIMSILWPASALLQLERCVASARQRRQLIDAMSSCADLLKGMTRRFDTAIWTPAHDRIEEIVGQRGDSQPAPEAVTSLGCSGPHRQMMTCPNRSLKPPGIRVTASWCPHTGSTYRREQRGKASCTELLTSSLGRSGQSAMTAPP